MTPHQITAQENQPEQKPDTNKYELALVNEEVFYVYNPTIELWTCLKTKRTVHQSLKDVLVNKSFNGKDGTKTYKLLESPNNVEMLKCFTSGEYLTLIRQ